MGHCRWGNSNGQGQSLSSVWKRLGDSQLRLRNIIYRNSNHIPAELFFGGITVIYVKRFLVKRNATGLAFLLKTAKSVTAIIYKTLVLELILNGRRKGSLLSQPTSLMNGAIHGGPQRSTELHREIQLNTSVVLRDSSVVLRVQLRLLNTPT